MPKRGADRFFDSYASAFNAIYGSRNTCFNRLINRLFRQSMRARFEKTIARCVPTEGKSALDVGCGPGHYSVALARCGMQAVYGIDFAPAMIELATRAAEEAGVAERCRFITGDFLTLEFDQKFHYTILMGFMDYARDPETVIRKALALTTNRAVFSFPAAEGFLAWQRRVRYRRKCDLYTYRREDIVRLFGDLPPDKLEIEKLHRDYFVVVNQI